MSKPKFIFFVWSELIFEAQREIRFYSFASTIIVIQESIVIIQIGLHLLDRLTFLVALFSWDVVLGVRYLLSASEPACSISLVLLRRPDARLHSYLVQARGFCEIQDIEFNPMSLFLCPECNVLINDLKIIPLCMSFCIQIIFQPKIVLDVIDFCYFTQIAIFKSRIKDEYILLIGNMNIKLWICKVSFS